MINSTEAIRALSEKLESMSHEEREEYFEKMGFSFDVAESDMNASEKDDFARYISEFERRALYQMMSTLSLSLSDIRKTDRYIARFASQFHAQSHKPSSTKKQGGKPVLVINKRKDNLIPVH